MPPRKQRMTRAEVLLRFAGSTLLAIAVAGLFIIAVLGAWHMYQRLAEATTKNDVAQKQLALLEEQKKQVEEHVAHLQSERGIEAALRERYGVAKPGEGVIEIVTAQTSTSTGVATSSENIFIRMFRTLFVW